MGEIPPGYIKPEGSLEITENGTFDVTEKAEVNVQVVAKPEKPYIDSSYIKDFSNFCSSSGNKELPIKNIDTRNGTNFSRMFYGRKDLTEIPELDTSNGTNFSEMFMNCTELSKIPELDTSNGTNFTSMLKNCAKMGGEYTFDLSNANSLEIMFYSVAVMANEDIKLNLKTTKNCKNFRACFQWCSSYANHKMEVNFSDTSAGENMAGMFYDGIKHACTKISNLDLSSATNVTSMFYMAKNLTELTMRGVIKISLSFSDSPLTAESAKSVINALADYSGTDNEFAYSVTFSSITLSLLEEEGATAPNNMTWLEYALSKCWNV